MKRWIIGLLTLAGCIGAIAAVTMYLQTWRRMEGNRQEQMRRLKSQVESLDEAAVERQYNLARWYNYNLERGIRREESYDAILSFDGAIGWLKVPGEDQGIPIWHPCVGGQWGAYHDPQSAFPVGNSGVGTILHFPEEQAFWPKAGDILTVCCLNREQLYMVEPVQEAEAPIGEGAGDQLLLIFEGKSGTRMLRCLRILHMPEGKGKTEEKRSFTEPTLAALGAAALPAAMWGFCQSAAALKNKGKRDEKCAKSRKIENKGKVSRK